MASKIAASTGGKYEEETGLLKLALELPRQQENA